MFGRKKKRFKWVGFFKADLREYESDAGTLQDEVAALSHIIVALNGEEQRPIILTKENE